MANPILVKVLATVATDKKVQTGIISIIAGVLFVAVIPIILILSLLGNPENQMVMEIDIIFNQSMTIPKEFSEESIKRVERLREEFKNLDIEISNLKSSEDKDLDEKLIKSFFYGLFYNENLEDTESEFYSLFVKCFDIEKVSDIEDNKKYKENLEELLGREITEKEMNLINSTNMYLKNGGRLSNFNGIPAEALNDETFRSLMTEATKYIGYPYVWGGSTPQSSFDCSGFVCWSFTESGVYNLSRTTAQGIYNQCTPIPASEIKAGDLVFFTKTYNSTNPVTHIGIYIGDGKMIHAGDPIGYADITTSYWVKHFYGFGRLKF